MITIIITGSSYIYTTQRTQKEINVAISKAMNKFKVLGVLFEIIFWGYYWDIFGGAIQ